MPRQDYIELHWKTVNLTYQCGRCGNVQWCKNGSKVEGEEMKMSAERKSIIEGVMGISPSWVKSRACDRSMSGAENGAERTENWMSGSGSGIFWKQWSVSGACSGEKR
jgi:hypothetical protein